MSPTCLDKILNYEYRFDFRNSWKDSIRVDLKEIDGNTRNWIDLAQDVNFRNAVSNAALDLWVP